MSEHANEFETLHEIVKKAKQRLTPNIWDYLIGGTETETTVKRNRMALDSLAFRPRVLRNVEHVDTSAEFLGQSLRRRSARWNPSRLVAAPVQPRRRPNSAP